MTETTAALRKTAHVRQPPDIAFELFTDRMAEWWPLDTHSVGRADARTVRVEHGVGGRIVETMAGGATALWGTVQAWDPPARVRFTWHPGAPPEEATEVEISFVATAEGTTVELVHTGWDRRPDGADARRNYLRGWDLVFGAYATAGSGALVTT
jgi:hypothetical protein